MTNSRILLDTNAVSGVNGNDSCAVPASVMSELYFMVETIEDLKVVSSNSPFPPQA